MHEAIKRPRVYLAGPDVFYPDARQRGAELCALCAAYGFEGLYPLDAQGDPRHLPRSEAIYQANRALIDQADACSGPTCVTGAVLSPAAAPCGRGGLCAGSGQARDRLKTQAPQGIGAEGYKGGHCETPGCVLPSSCCNSMGRNAADANF